MRNRWVIPDIHGYSMTLRALIEDVISLSKEDSVYFLGDYIDRGHDSKGVIDYIISLKESGFDVHCIRGNHEDYCIRAWEADQKRFLFRSKLEKEWRKNGGNKTLQSFEAKRPREINKFYIEWMKNTKYFIELENCILVHAGLNFDINNPFDDVHAMMWLKNFKVDKSRIDGKKVIHGHVPIEMSMIGLFKDNDYDFLPLDNGIYYKRKDGFGNLLAYNIDTNEIAIQRNIDFEYNQR